MRALITTLKLMAASALMLISFTACESTDGGGSASGSVYYGVGVYDPWYYGGYHDDVDIIVNPPDRPSSRPHPSQPIARPTPAPRPMPSIPSTPRASFRR